MLIYALITQAIQLAREQLGHQLYLITNNDSHIMVLFDSMLLILHVFKSSLVQVGVQT